jgi:hypothetical protein
LKASRTRLRDLDPGNLGLDSLTGPNYSPTQADIDGLSEALREAPGDRELGCGARGVALERQHLAGERTLPPTRRPPMTSQYPSGEGRLAQRG